MPLDELTLKELTLKLVMLTALLSGQKCLTLHALDTAHMSVKDKKYTFFVKSVLKYTRRGAYQAPIEPFAFKDNRNLRVISTLSTYNEHVNSDRSAPNCLLDCKLCINQ